MLTFVEVQYPSQEWVRLEINGVPLVLENAYQRWGAIQALRCALSLKEEAIRFLYLDAIGE